MSCYTPLESKLFARIAQALGDAGAPVDSIKVFGSRARGHSSERSDLDVAVEFAIPPNPALIDLAARIGRQISVHDERSGYALSVQVVPLFRGEEHSVLAHTIARDADTVWTKT